VLTHRRLADAEFFGDEHAADAVVDQVAIDLRPEVRGRVLEPLENLEASIVVERSEGVEQGRAGGRGRFGGRQRCLGVYRQLAK
jgi:hypothetical protein